MSTSDGATNPGNKRPREKKWPLRGAAKFREETPRKGGGLAIKDRDTALQQYGEKPFSVQAQKCIFRKIFTAEILEKTSQFCLIFRHMLPSAALVRRNNTSLYHARKIHALVVAAQQKSRAPPVLTPRQP